MTIMLGIHAVRQALLAGSGRKLILRQGRLNRRLQEIADIARTLDCPIEVAPPTHDALGGEGVALEVPLPVVRSERELSGLLGQARDNWLFLVLDGITDPRNFGACLRSAATFGVDGVLVPKDRSAPLNTAAVKTASGAASLVPVFQVTNLARVLDKLKKTGVWVVGTEPGEAQPLTETDLKGHIALVMGAEDTGLRRKTKERCDLLVGIPMTYPGLSLNVSVAAGICLYEARRQRQAEH